jgi:S-DNA-T family DNA segregation ATPase FtsK/SpoIIIE
MSAMAKFSRPPRLREVAEPVDIGLPSAPAPPKLYSRSSMAKVLLITLLPTLLPPVALGVVTVVIGAPSTVFITSAALMTSLGLAIGITTLLSRRDEDARIKADQREYEALRRQFEAEVAAVSAEAGRLVAREAQILARDFPPPRELVARTADIETSTWERRRSDPDFLELRLGLGRRRTCLRFPNEAMARGSDPLLGTVIERLVYHASAPITAAFGPFTRAGAFGRDEAVTPLLCWLILQAAAFHAPGDLSIAVFSRDDRLCSWGKWLPHCRLKSARETTHLVARRGTEATRALRAINHEFLSRAAPEDGPIYFVVADARSWESLPGRLSRWLPAGSPAVSILLVKERYEDISGDCDFVLDLSSPSSGRILRRVESVDAPAFELEGLAPDAALKPALALAPLDVVEGDSRGAVPSSCRLADLLGSAATTVSGVIETWGRTRHAFRLAAPIGVGPGDAAVEIDLRRDGPHGLLAGTTGSGKSEFLQSLVVSLAAQIPPDLLNFVLIDYKGGSAFREVAALPHVVGVVTDLDERLAARALTSLRAEMKRREHLLATTSPPAVNIIEYQSRPRQTPLANLFIIIDEFHRLVSEQPDFIEQMVQIAQQGRSLGVHLLLSTQKPSGVVSDHIRANTNLRICLRVTDETDSRDVLGGPEAAHIPRDLPGRVYIKTGTEPLKVGQAARVSGLIPARQLQAAEVEAERFLAPLAPRVSRRHGLVARQLPPSVAAPVTEDDHTDPPVLVDERAEIVGAITSAAERSGFPPQVPPWQEYLPEMISLEMLPLATNQDSGSTWPIHLGLLDEPESQRQGPFEVDFGGGHVCVAGGANTGKTTALLTVAAAAARQAGPDALHLYGIDFAGGGLEPLSGLPHCGGIAAQHEPPRVRWVLQALKDFVAERLARASVAGTDIGRPRILVLIDNFSAFYNALQSLEGGQEASDDLLEIMDLGRSVGVSFAISVERPDSLRAGILALTSTRLALELADPEGYSTLGLSRAKRAAEVIPGRALMPGHIIHEVQIAHPGEVLASLAKEPAAETELAGAPLRIAPLPSEIAYADVLRRVCGEEARNVLLLGLQDGTKPLFRYPVGEHLLVLGPRRSGRSNALAVAVAESRRIGAVQVSVLNPRRSRILRNAASGGEPCSTRYAERGPDVEALWGEMVREVGERFRAYSAGDDTALSPWAIIIDDADVLDIPPDADEALQQLVLRGTDVGASVFVSADTQALRSSYPAGAMRALLNLRTGILLAPNTMEDFDLLGVRGKPARMPPGRGYACGGGARHAVQLALFGCPEAH